MQSTEWNTAVFAVMTRSIEGTHIRPLEISIFSLIRGLVDEQFAKNCCNLATVLASGWLSTKACLELRLLQ